MDVDHGLLLEHSEVELTDTLLESSTEPPSDFLETDPHPSDHILALLSAAVHAVKQPGQTDAAYGERLDLPEGWRLLTTGSNPDLTNGYFGAAFIDTEMQQVVIAHRGTNAAKVEPLKTDFIEKFMEIHPIYVEYMMSDRELIKNTSGGLHAKTVVFDSPGAKVTLYILVIDLSSYEWENLERGLYNVQTHAICNFGEAFKKSSLNLSDVSNWVNDIDRYVSMNQTLNQANNYQVELEKGKRIVYFEELKKHYQFALSIKTSKNAVIKSNLKAFSDDEIKILESWKYIKNQTGGRILNEYLLEKRLNIKYAKLFPDFGINLNDGMIVCESKQLLELTRRLKQLMRWLGPRKTLSKAVEEQNTTIDLIYRAESQTYLDSLQKTSLNFKDSIGLREFLFSATDRVLWIITQDSELEMIRLYNVFSQIKDINVSNQINKYTAENHYAFLDFPRLQRLCNIYNSPFHQNNLMIVDCSSTATIISSEVCTFLNNYVRFFLHNMKKLVLISSETSVDIFDSLESIKIVKIDQNIGLTDLSTESLETVLQRKLILTGNKLNSFNDFLGENFSSQEIDQFLSLDFFKKIVTDEDYFVTMKDTRPNISDLQMPIIKTNIATSMEHVLNCLNLPETLVVFSGFNREDLETGDSWEQLKGNIILAEGDAELFFKDTCDKNEDKTIYLLEVSGDAKTDLRCKKIFSRGLYVPRKFIHRACINLQELIESLHPDDIFVICSEERKALLLGSIGNCEKIEEFSKILHIATKEEETDVIQKHFNKNIHFVEIEQSDKILKLEWRFSHGSVKNLIPFMSTDLFEPIDEITLSRTERNLVILIDEPGMGKTTSLASLSRLIETTWVIHIELKQFKTHIDSLSDDFTPKNVANFLLSEVCSNADHSLAHGLLEYLLQSENCSKKVVLMFDGFDEMDDYNKNKDSSKDKLVKLFDFLQSKPTIQVFLTARKYLKKSLETNLRHFSTSFVTIDAQEQQRFLFTFWRSFLPLELRINRKQEEKRLEEYAAEVLRQAKLVLGPDVDCFMGIPLQLRMLAEVFRPQSDLLLQSPEILLKRINIVSGPNLYQRFISQKYEIYLHDKLLIGKTLDDDDINDNYLEPITNAHGELGFKTFFPVFFNSNPDYFKGISEKNLVKLNRVGLIESQKRGTFQFVHRTYAEFCCAQMLVHWLSGKQNPITYQLIKDILLPKILLNPDTKVIRLFVNAELNEKPMSKTAINLTAEYIRQLWVEDNVIFRNEKHRTPLHIAIQENNEQIVSLLLAGLNVESSREAFVSFVTQYDVYNDTALHLIDKQTSCSKIDDDLLCASMIGNILKRIETYSLESKEKILFACLFNRNISKSYISNNFISGNVSDDTLTVLKNVVTRVEIVESEISRFERALFKNNVKLAKKMLLQQLKNNIERYCLLLTKQKKFGMKTALHLAACRCHLEVVKLLSEQAFDLFTVMLTRPDEDKKTPLHFAAEFGHLEIVKVLLEHGADINTRCNEGKTALMYATYNGHPATVKYLIESGAKINSKQKDGSSALHTAVSKGNFEIVQYLIERGAEVNAKKKGSTALHIAASKNNSSIVKYLIESGAEINSKKKGNTALSLAVSKDNMSIVTYLIESGAEINSKKGSTALFTAVSKDNVSMVQYLVENGADVNSKQKDGCTALHIAASINSLPIIKYLVERGAQINSVNNDGMTALHVAAENSVLRGSIVKYLIEVGIEIDCTDTSGRTALYIAACEGRHQLVEFLLQQGADPDKKARLGRTALTMATLGRKWDVARVLLEGAAGADADNGQALGEAIRWKKWGIVSSLVHLGASILECDVERNLTEFKERFPKYIFKNPSQNEIKVLQATSEIKEQEVQSKSIIMCNVPESVKLTEADRILDDQAAVISILREIDKLANENIVKFYRVGKISNNKTRPIKIELQNSIQSRKILGKRGLLKNNVRIFPDTNPAQQKFLNDLRVELEKRKANGEDVTIKYIDSIPRIVPNQQNN